MIEPVVQTLNEKPKIILRKKKPLEPWKASRLFDIEMKLKDGIYGGGSSKYGYNLNEDIRFLLETINELRKVDA